MLEMPAGQRASILIGQYTKVLSLQSKGQAFSLPIIEYFGSLTLGFFSCSTIHCRRPASSAPPHVTLRELRLQEPIARPMLWLLLLPGVIKAPLSDTLGTCLLRASMKL